MKAAMYSRWGSADVIQIQDVPIPVPGENEILIAVRAASLNPLDWRLMRGRPYVTRLMFGNLRRPHIRPGRDVAGIVEAVGRNATRFKAGDAVFGMCKGAFAEYACASEASLSPKPDGVTFEQAASAPVAAITALQGLRDKARLASGQTVLINGASGGVGTFAVQIAKSLCADVTGVCSTPNLEMVRSIGADRVVDYTREDFTSDGRRYDVVFDCVANRPLSAYRRALNRSGVCIIVGARKDISTAGLLSYLVTPLVVSRFGSQKFITFIARGSARDLAVVGEFIASGNVAPVIDRRYGLREISDAVRYVEQGHARGKVVIAIASGGESAASGGGMASPLSCRTTPMSSTVLP